MKKEKVDMLYKKWQKGCKKLQRSFKMKIIMINSSPRTNGNTSIALKTIKEVFDKENVDVKYYDIGNLNIVSCKACVFVKLKDIVYTMIS
jgi:Multimeric flavodoxin WrbA